MKKIIKYINEKIISKTKKNFRWILTGIIAGLILGWLLFHSGEKISESITGHEEHEHVLETNSKGETVWTCSMHPQIKQDKPGQCPICAMDLIPLLSMQSDEEGLDLNEIQMTEAAAKLADIQTLVIGRGSPQKTVYLQGRVYPDERNIAELTSRFGGRIEKLFVNFTGQNVKKGQKLATIYSPDLVTAQRELLEATAYKDKRPAMYYAAIGKLKLWDLNEEQISAIEEKGEPQLYFDILSPITGTVTMRHVALGDYVKEGTALFKVIDLKKIWVMFDAYESDLPWIKSGDKIDFTIQSIPGKNYSAKVSYIDPFINRKTRVAQLRVELKNNDMQIKPEMFTSGILQSNIADSYNEILIPKTSILWTGKRAVVYVKVPDRENPSFLYREIVLGPEAGSFFVVKEGLEEGEEIAVNGVFKIDAAAQLIGLKSMMNPEGGKMSTGHDHSSMTMPGEKSTKENIMQGSKDMNIARISVDKKFIKQLITVYKAYLEMTDAFIESDSKKASDNAGIVKEMLENIDMSLLNGDPHMIWMEQLNNLNKSITIISTEKKIDIQREFFAQFNQVFYKTIKTFGLDKTTTYYQYCPMANGDKGAYWFSAAKEIRNPYFGDMMMTCGETRETIK